MDCEAFSIFYFKEAELKLLLAGLGVHTWYGIFSEKDSVGRDFKQKYHQIMAELYQKDVINWKNDQISVKKPYADMISLMLAQKKCVTIESEQEQYPKQCGYIHLENVVVTRKSQREEHTLSLQQMRISQWLQSLEEEICSLEDRQSLSICCRNSFNGQELEHIKICQKGIRTYLNENTFYQKQALRRKMEEWAEPSFLKARQGIQGGKPE